MKIHESIVETHLRYLNKSVKMPSCLLCRSSSLQTAGERMAECVAVLGCMLVLLRGMYEAWKESLTRKVHVKVGSGSGLHKMSYPLAQSSGKYSH